MRTSFMAAGFAGLLMLVAIGCGDSGPKQLDVSGSVTYDGTDVSSGEIFFTSDDKSIGAVEAKIKDGKYTTKLREGKHKVEIRASRVVPGKKGPMGTEDLLEAYIPKKYNDQSTLTVEVGAGKTTHDFKLDK